jgi:formylglycine-generating enzyme required for sulfatase activity
LRPLARRNAHELFDRRWDYDFSQLIAAIQRIPTLEAAPVAEPSRGRHQDEGRKAAFEALLRRHAEDPKARVAAIEAFVEQNGDPRFRADAWQLPDEPLLGFISVAAGPFPMGSDPKRDRLAREEEQPPSSVDLPEFCVARYPVTVAQFRVFVEKSGFAVGDSRCLRGVPNHPVVWVSWHEALAYCRWLTDTLRSSDATPHDLRARLAEGWVVTLPSEAEWEKAARGTDGRVYPWGTASILPPPTLPGPGCEPRARSAFSRPGRARAARSI